ncbi:hypothetical protein AKJ52_02550 [candidate division MSBL1 archaeon SCGC-AAA382C18]|uniref:MPN domain-containing protein n=1 Tax=candidate division MSBL1 archaeon SCGC-AAA382C18 TaxID=1698281 RepID=A0A133VI64_9EURY|nr:hypothetical protein AKJ52_02550 [candidate division MSBL1 archaeon SCGC-AAA382C18]
MIREIDQEALKLILHASKSSHPAEFAGILRSEGEKITEVLFLAGTTSSESSALMRLDMLPVSSEACGSVHSHPSGVISPSEQDLFFFDRIGEIHIITGHPYNEDSWKAFDSKGHEITLTVVKGEDAHDFHDFYEEF